MKEEKDFLFIDSVEANLNLGYAFTRNDLFSLLVVHPLLDKYKPLIKKHYETLGNFCVAIDEDMIKRFYNAEYGLTWNDLEDYITDAFTNLEEIENV